MSVENKEHTPEVLEMLEKEKEMVETSETYGRIVHCTYDQWKEWSKNVTWRNDG